MSRGNVVLKRCIHHTQMAMDASSVYEYIQLSSSLVLLTLTTILYDRP